MALANMSLDEVEAIFDLSFDAIVVIDQHGQPVYHNRVFAELSEHTRSHIIAHHHCPDLAVSDYHVHRVSIRCGTVVILASNTPYQEQETVLAALVRGMENSDNIYTTAAQAVSKALGWRWISVTRFNGSLVEVLAHCAEGEIVDNFSFEIAGTPCEAMARTQRFTLFSDVAQAFPENQELQKMGAKTYAGLVYRDKDNQAVGHIMAIHDHRDIDYRHTEEVLTLATLALSSHLMLDQTHQKLQTAIEESRTDPLTHLYNRKLFDENISASVERFKRNQCDACLAIIDVDDFKGYNDTFGHAEGDRLLKLLATELTKLGREADFAYRIGGDEFAMIFADANEHIVTRADRQFHAALKNLSLITQRDVSGSIGYAMLSDCSDAKDWYHQADQDMYRRKAGE